MSIFGGFLNISVNFDRFLGLIFPFWAHFQFRDTVYKRRESEADVLPIGDTTLGITSVRNRCQKNIDFGNIFAVNLHTFGMILHFTELNYLHASLSQMRFQVG